MKNCKSMQKRGITEEYQRETKQGKPLAQKINLVSVFLPSK